MSACSPDEAKRNPGLSQRSIREAAPGLRCAPSGLQADMPHRPGCRWRQGSPSSSCPFSPIGACGTSGRKCRARGARWLGGQPGCRSKDRNNGTRARLSSNERRSSDLSRPQKQTFTCVPHADGFFGLLDVPGFAASAHAPRSCVLTPGHSLVPSALIALVRGNLYGPPHPAPRRDDHRSALRIGTGRLR